MIHNLSDQYALTKALLQDKEREVLTFEYVRGKLLEAEKNLQEQGSVKAFSVTQKQILDEVSLKGKPRATQGAAPTQVSQQKHVSFATQKRMLDPCSYCGKAGHSTERCWERRATEWKKNNPGRQVPDFRKQDLLNKKARQGSRQQTPPRVSQVTFQEEECPPFIMAAGKSLTGILVDSAAQVSLVGDLSLFISYSPFIAPRLLQGAFTGTQGRAQGTGTILLHLKDPQGQVHQLELKDVHYVEGAASNLIAISTLMAAGLSLHFAADSGACTITNRAGELIANIPTAQGLWPLPVVAAPTPQVAHVHLQSSPSDVLHLKLGHLSPAGVKFLVVNQKLSGLPKKLGELQPCHSCNISKFPKRKFPKLTTVHPHSRPLSTVSMDTIGPFRCTSRGGARYNLTIVDHHTRYTWARPVARKSEIPFHVVGWANQARNLKDSSIQVLRTDNGSEFLNKTISAWAHTEGIHHQTSIPENPQQNGLAECHNKLLTSITRTSLLWSGAPNHWWAEALVCAAHTLNHWPATFLKGTTPIQAWSGTKADVQNLHPWGCTAYTRVDPSHRSDPKLGPRGKRCMYLGPSATSKGFRFYDTETRKIFESRDVIWYDSTPFYIREPDPTPDGKVATEQDLFEEEDDEEELENNYSLALPKSPSPRVPPTEPRIQPHPSSNQAPRKSRRLQGLQAKIPLVALAASEVPLEITIPRTWQQAMASPEKDQWYQAAQKEYQNILKNETYDLIPLTEVPAGANILGNMWVFKLKPGNLFRARMVVGGDWQIEGLDFFEVFAPTAKLQTFRCLLHLSAHHDLEMEQFDFVTAFMNGDIEDDVYMRQPQGFTKTDQPTHVCKLKKGLNGIRQAPRAWYAKLTQGLLSLGLTQNPAEPTMFQCITQTTKLFVLVFVDDLLCAASTTELIHNLGAQLGGMFEIKLLGSLTTYLGMDIVRDRELRTVTLSQEKYIEHILTKFHAKEAFPKDTPMEPNHDLTNPTGPLGQPIDPKAEPYPQLVGTLMYLMVCTRPDLAFTLSVLSRFMHPTKTKQAHWKAARRVLHYLRRTSHWTLTLGGIDNPKLQGYCDSSWGDDKETRRSTLGYCLSLGKGAVSWKAQLSQVVALSSGEAEYYAAGEAVREAQWLKHLLTHMGVTEAPYVVKCDSQTALASIANPIISARNKHIEIKHHFIRDLVSQGAALFHYVQSKQNLADGLTKALPASEHFQLFQLMMRDWDKGGAEGKGDAPVSTGGREALNEPAQKKLKVSEIESVPLVSFTVLDLS
jgi:hypothetical protein